MSGWRGTELLFAVTSPENVMDIGAEGPGGVSAGTARRVPFRD